jgi:hypothetical protein
MNQPLSSFVVKSIVKEGSIVTNATSPSCRESRNAHSFCAKPVYVNISHGRAPETVFAGDFAYQGIKMLKGIYDKANLKRSIYVLVWRS